MEQTALRCAALRRAAASDAPLSVAMIESGGGGGSDGGGPGGLGGESAEWMHACVPHVTRCDASSGIG